MIYPISAMRNKTTEDRREAHVSASVPKWVDDKLRLLAYQNKATRSRVVCDLLVKLFTEEELGNVNGTK